MDKDKVLDAIFNDDPLGLLNVKAKVSNVRTGDERLVSSFKEISDFVRKNGREPEGNLGDIIEYQLYSRLKGIREDEEKKKSLISEDECNLLGKLEKEIKSIDDIFDDDTFDLLSGDEEGLFDLKHVPADYERASADFVARRKVCKDFANYESLFTEVHKELVDGKRKLVDFNYESLREGEYYINNGILLYLEKVYFERIVQKFKSGVHNRPDGRTRIIFENGTESDMMFQSLYKALHVNGKMVTHNIDKVNEGFVEKFSNIQSEDEAVGYLYVLRSLSSDSRISEIDDLYKIGYSTVEVEDRIKNAEKEATYLMAPVSIVGAWKCYNMNPQKFEQLIHTFFGNTCLEVDVFDIHGKRCTPREWFVAPIEVIEQAIEMIINGNIVDYRYDVDSMAILRR